MKRSLQAVFGIILMLSFSCEGPDGPMGPEGERGPAGLRGPAGEDAQRSIVLDYFVDFEADEEGNYIGVMPLGELELSESAIVLVFALEMVVPDGNNNNMLFWSPLPRTYPLNEGTVTYTYAYANRGVLLFLETEINMEELSQEQRESYTQDQIFRFVAIPGEAYLENQRSLGSIEDIKSLSYKEVLKRFNISDKDVPVINKP